MGQRQRWWPCAGCTTLALHGCGARTSTSLHSVTRPRGAPAAAGLRSAAVRGWTALRRLTCLCHLCRVGLRPEARHDASQLWKSRFYRKLHLIALGVVEKHRVIWF